MDLAIKDKIAFVNGASSGIGAAAAEVLAAEGADVILAYHQNLEGVKKAAEQITSMGRRAWLCQMDLADQRSVSAALEQLKQSHPKIDIAILCAGYNQVTTPHEITPAEWEQIFSVNLGGVFFVLQGLMPLLQRGGSIVTVASVAAHTGAPHHMHYAAAKAGLVNLTKSFARELAPHIRVNCVAPGITLTEMGEDTLRALPEDYLEKKLLVPAYATPQDIARCIVFAASPVAGFMTGATIDINGGRDLR
jgi:3-oxoacyl-[acyl-carrier protein] reductase